MVKLFLSWGEFDATVAAMAYDLQGESFSSVYGHPRGGLTLAVALSHALNRPLVQQCNPHSLFVDDIWDTGKTWNDLGPALGTYPALSVFWFRRANVSDFPNSCIAYEIAPVGVWIVFPWENKQTEGT